MLEPYFKKKNKTEELLKIEIDCPDITSEYNNIYIFNR